MAGTSLGSAYVQIVPKAEGIEGAIKGLLSGPSQAAGSSAGSKLGGALKKAIVAAGIGTAVVGVIKGAMSEGAKLQQSYLGGLDTLYGDAAEGARAYAREAAQAGISMNTYSEQAVSFGAALKNAYGGDTFKAMEAANTAILDMADNSAKMGTDISSVQMAYQGFAKQNYTMLDNLKLGYGGTKSEMERLLADAEKLSGVEYNIDNLGDVYDAIHVIQEDLGLTGVAASEASETFSGSFNAMKASAQNFLGSLALGENVSGSLSALMTSVSTFFFNNFIPMLGTIVSSLPGAIWTFLSQGVPMLLNNISSLVSTLTSNIGNLANTLTGEKVATWVTTTLPKLLAAAGSMIGKFVSGLIINLPKIIAAVGRIGAEIVKGLGVAIWGKVTAAAAGIRDRFMAKVNEIIGRAAATAASIRDRFMAPIEAIKEKVQAVIDKVKSFFPISIGRIMSNIKLPHFSITGKFGLDPPQTPKLSIDWYAKGGIFDAATVLGGIGLGEAGPEAILPLTPFWDKMDKIASSMQNNAGDVTINVYATPSMDVKELAVEVERQIINAQNRRRLAWQ